MGTILPRKRKNGTTGYHAQIVIRRVGEATHRETRTFDRRQAALAWIEKRETELSKPGGVALARADDPALAAVIDRYIAESRKAIGRTKAQVLRAIKTTAIGDKRCSTIGSADIVAFAQELGTRMLPQTVANYLSHLGAVFAIARPAWGYPLDQSAMKDAFTVANRLGMTTKSRMRDRRPTLAELDLLMTHFAERQVRRSASVPMQKVIGFAIFSTRRTEEIARILWSDLNVEGSRILVRDMKNPGETIGNDSWCDLTPEALAIILSMPKVAPEIFPYSPGAIGAAFTRAGVLLGIKDLHFHDLRHEGVSRLFELGWSIPRVAVVSGHRSWTSLKRYTHLRQVGDKFEGWQWFSTVLSHDEQSLLDDRLRVCREANPEAP